MDRSVAWGVALAVLLFAASSARAQPDDTTRLRARTLGDEGNALFDKGDYRGALDRYDRAAVLVNVPTLGLWAARCLEKLGRLVEASERYLAVSRAAVDPEAPDVHKEAVVSAREEREALLPRIPSITVTVAGERRAALTLDNKTFPSVLVGVKTPIDPGTHRLEARAGASRDVREFSIAEGNSMAIELRLPERPKPIEREPEQSSWLTPVRGVGLAALGLGLIGVAVGAGTTGALAVQKSDLVDNCGDELRCGATFFDDAKAYNRLRIASTTGWIVGGVFTAAGVILVAIPSDEPAQSALSIGFASASFEVKF
jgi:hypothetical protein